MIFCLIIFDASPDAPTRTMPTHALFAADSASGDADELRQTLRMSGRADANRGCRLSPYYRRASNSATLAATSRQCLLPIAAVDAIIAWLMGAAVGLADGTGRRRCCHARLDGNDAP